MAEGTPARSGLVMLQELEVGQKVKLKGGVIAEVTGNPKDGSWIFVKYLENPKEPANLPEDELAFAADVEALA
jgi:hypothetical protein